MYVGHGDEVSALIEEEMCTDWGHYRYFIFFRFAVFSQFSLHCVQVVRMKVTDYARRVIWLLIFLQVTIY